MAREKTMGKALSRLLIVILIALCGYLYVQVVNLQKENKQLASQVQAISRVQVENDRARSTEVSSNPVQASREITRTDSAYWIEKSREHMQLAEQAVAKGNFADAVKQTRFSNLALNRAADRASAQSRQTVAGLRSRLDELQTKAKNLWHQFGG